LIIITELIVVILSTFLSLLPSGGLEIHVESI